MKFVAIDFETANNSADSPCQLGAVVVNGGRIVEEYSWMIRPKRMFFSAACVSVHGIRPKDVVCESEWDQLWPEISAVLENQILVAHNASFDMRVLSATLATYDLDCPSYQYSCTRLLARRTWPGGVGYGLKNVARSLGISFRHHDGLEDARVCAKIVLASAAEAGVGNWTDLEDALSVTRGAIRSGELRGPKTKRRSSRRDGSSSAMQDRGSNIGSLLSIEQVTSLVGDSRPLKGRNVVLCGTILDFDAIGSADLLRALGANVQPKMNMVTHYLIVGKSQSSSDDDNSELAAFDIRQTEAKRRADDGQPIQILTHRQLIRFLPNGMALVRAITQE